MTIDTRGGTSFPSIRTDTRQDIQALPVRAPHNLAMAAAVRLWQAGKKWVADDPVILRQLADGLRSLPAGYPTTHCRSEDPIRGYAHAHQVMDVHAAHRCPRYEAAAAYASEVRW